MFKIQHVFSHDYVHSTSFHFSPSYSPLLAIVVCPFELDMVWFLSQLLLFPSVSPYGWLIQVSFPLCRLVLAVPSLCWLAGLASSVDSVPSLPAVSVLSPLGESSAPGLSFGVITYALLEQTHLFIPLFIRMMTISSLLFVIDLHLDNCDCLCLVCLYLYFVTL